MTFDLGGESNDGLLNITKNNNNTNASGSNDFEMEESNNKEEEEEEDFEFVDETNNDNNSDNNNSDNDNDKYDAENVSYSRMVYDNEVDEEVEDDMEVSNKPILLSFAG